MTEMTAVGIDVSGQIIVLDQLEQDLNDGGVATPNGLTIEGPARDPSTLPDPLPPPGALLPCTDGSRLYTYDDEGNPADLPPGAEIIVESYAKQRKVKR
jgi:hypothetical protein